MTGRQLRALFNKLNERYFGARLPPHAIRSSPTLAKRKVLGLCRWERGLILIDRTLSDADSEATLLHEMVHAARPGGHHKRWAMEMVRIQDMGAPLTGDDLDLKMKLDRKLYDGPVNRPTKRDFQRLTSNAFMRFPDITLRQSVCLYINTCGAPVETAADFLARYQWAKAVYREERRQATAERHSQEMWRLLDIHNAGGELTPEQAKAQARWIKQTEKSAHG